MSRAGGLALNLYGILHSCVAYYPCGSTHYTSGTLNTDEKSTGQRLI